jgi:hypothetical protein
MNHNSQESGPDDWRKSSYSWANGDCAEVATGPDTVRVRDSTDRDGPVLGFSLEEWKRYTATTKLGGAAVTGPNQQPPPKVMV